AAISALLFAVPMRLLDPSQMLTMHSLNVMTGLFLTGMLLGLLRLMTGSILLPAGLLAGWIVVRRVVAKAGLLQFEDSPWLDWVAPNHDPRQAPLMFAFLILASAV